MTDKPNKTEKYYSPILKSKEEKKNDSSFKIARYRMKLAIRISDAMKDLGWKNVDLAEKMNKHESEISKWLSGRHAFNSDTLCLLGDVLGIELFNLEEKKSQTIVHEMRLVVSSKTQTNVQTNTTPFIKEENSDARVMMNGTSFLGNETVAQA